MIFLDTFPHPRVFELRRTSMQVWRYSCSRWSYWDWILLLNENLTYNFQWRFFMNAYEIARINCNCWRSLALSDPASRSNAPRNSRCKTLSLRRSLSNSRLVTYNPESISIINKPLGFQQNNTDLELNAKYVTGSVGITRLILRIRRHSHTHSVQKAKQFIN